MLYLEYLEHVEGIWSLGLQSQTNSSLIYVYYSGQKDWNYSRPNDLEIVIKNMAFQEKKLKLLAKNSSTNYNTMD